MAMHVLAHTIHMSDSFGLILYLIFIKYQIPVNLIITKKMIKNK